MLWSALGTNTTASTDEILQQYAAYFIPGPSPADVAQLLLSLEQNWVGSLATNPSVSSTLALALTLADTYPDLMLTNWRLQVQFAARSVREWCWAHGLHGTNISLMPHAFVHMSSMPHACVHMSSCARM
jgi:hypothetical protein